MEEINTDNLSAYQIDEKIVEAEKELKELINQNQIVEQEKLNLQREILELQVKKKNLEISLSKSTTNIRQLTITLKILRSKFWAAKDQGL